MTAIVARSLRPQIEYRELTDEQFVACLAPFVGYPLAIPNTVLGIIPQGGHVPIFDPLVPFAETALKFLDGWRNSTR